MVKIIILVFALAGFYAMSAAFFPSVWMPFSWHLPFTTMFLSWGWVCMIGILIFGMKLKAK